MCGNKVRCLSYPCKNNIELRVDWIRWVLKDGGEPTLGACVPVIENKGDDEEGKPSILPYMYWLKVGC